MVSFQCHSCGDVVKKPKLDQHRSRCQSGFDCLDCSKTFNTPTDYKSHTSCISEAEKYQKSMYKAPNKNNQQDGYHQQENRGGRGRGGYNQNGNRGGGYFGRGGGPHQQQYWDQPRTRATGANDTPLGTPSRMSPISKPTDSEEDSKKEEEMQKAMNVGPKMNVEEEKVNEKKENEKMKDKKRKTKDEEAQESGERSKKKVKLEKAVEPASIPLPSSPTEHKDEEQKRKKEKKAEKEKKSKSKGATKDTHPISEEPGTDEKKERKKEKKEKERSKKVQDVTDIQHNGTDCKVDANGDVEMAQAAPQGLESEKDGKKKKEKRRKDDGGEDSAMSIEVEKKSKKEKKEKKEKKAKKERVE